MGELRYTWLRDKKNVPVACIASKKERNLVQFAVSAHNPLDKFNKKAGRDAAAVKFAEGEVVAVNTDGNIKVNILKAIITNPTIAANTSTRAVNAARYRLKTYKPLDIVIKNRFDGV